MNLFYVKQKVVCIGHWETVVDKHGNDLPRFGYTYTIRGFSLDADDHPELYHRPMLGLYFEEIRNKLCPCKPDGHLDELAFASDHFRPLIENELWSEKKARELT